MRNQVLKPSEGCIASLEEGSNFGVKLNGPKEKLEGQAMRIIGVANTKRQ
jgi:hypothetical protein